MKPVARLWPLSLLVLLHAGAAWAELKITMARTVPAFRAVELAGALDVELTIGDPTRVTVTAEPDLVDQVSTKVEDGVLVLDTARNLRKHEQIHVAITVRDLSAVSLRGSGTIRVAGVTGERFAIAVSGTGEVTATGSTGALRVAVDGIAKIVADRLAARDVAVEVTGTGQVSVRASRSLEAKATGTANIEVHGRPPRVVKSLTGAAAVHLR